MRKLYISDLDGTLLNQHAVISSASKQLLNAAIAKGAEFTIATARSIAMTHSLIEGLDLYLPIVLMNGVFLYDPVAKRYLRTLALSPSTTYQIGSLFEHCQIPCFMYTLQNETLVLYHRHLKSWQEQHFLKRRKNKSEKQFVHCDNIPYSDTSLQVVYFAVVGTKEQIDHAIAQIQNITNMRFAYYSDVYEPNMWYLEIFHPDADKSNAVKELKSLYSFGQVCAFGDNFNDIALFQIADECCAVSNAIEPLKLISSHVISSNICDGVAHWMYDRFCMENP